MLMPWTENEWHIELSGNPVLKYLTERELWSDKTKSKNPWISIKPFLLRWLMEYQKAQAKELRENREKVVADFR